MTTAAEFQVRRAGELVVGDVVRIGALGHFTVEAVRPSDHHDHVVIDFGHPWADCVDRSQKYELVGKREDV